MLVPGLSLHSQKLREAVEAGFARIKAPFRVLGFRVWAP